MKTLSHAPQADPEAIPDIGPTAFEWGCINSLRRAARIICSLRPDEGIQPQATTQDRLPSWPKPVLKSVKRIKRWLRNKESKGDRPDINTARRWDPIIGAAAPQEYTSPRNLLFGKPSRHQSRALEVNRKQQQEYQHHNYSEPSRFLFQPQQSPWRKSTQVSSDYNTGSAGHTPTNFCPAGRSHVGASCHHPHPQFNHFAPKGKDKGSSKGKDNSSSKGKNKGSSKDKSKGKGHEEQKGKR
jgi:hypothetical protein